MKNLFFKSFIAINAREHTVVPSIQTTYYYTLSDLFVVISKTMQARKHDISHRIFATIKQTKRMKKRTKTNKNTPKTKKQLNIRHNAQLQLQKY